MQFQKGKPRHPNAGRRAGTPNKSTLVASEVVSIVYEGKSIPERLAEIAKTNRKYEVQILIALLPYCCPKLTSMEITNHFQEKVIELEKNIDGVFDAAIDAHLELRGEARTPKSTLQK